MSEETKKPSRRLMEKLLEERIVLLSEPVMPDSSERIVAQLLYLNTWDKKAPIPFWINTPGGSRRTGYVSACRPTGTAVPTVARGWEAVARGDADACATARWSVADRGTGGSTLGIVKRCILPC